MTILVTGGAGFIGANFVVEWVAGSDETVVNLDKLTYAGNLDNLAEVSTNPGHVFRRGDIADRDLVEHLLREFRPRAVLNFAAESHVDRSIGDPTPFLTTNVIGTFQLLEASRQYVSGLPADEKAGFRFLQVSTDEVYGSLGLDDAPFSEQTPYRPNSPYSASKASADHMVRAYHRTYGLPTLTTNCSNNYGPRQYAEKFIPVVINSALSGAPIPVYGDGRNVRDWLYVSDHCSALRTVLQGGTPGETYNIGGGCELSNIDLAQQICELLDELHPRTSGDPHSQLISSVADRPGHDFRYAIDGTKLTVALGWQPRESFETGLRKTVQWYLGAALQQGHTGDRPARS